MKQTKPNLIFFGNGPLADTTLSILQNNFTLLFHARTQADLEKVVQIKTQHPDSFGVLASFGVLIPTSILQLFQPIGILNLHPSLLPLYRGASPIETAILNGDTTFGVSIMQLVPAMDAGPIYYQATITADQNTSKAELYQRLATIGADWLSKNLTNLPQPTPQDDTKATFTTKLTKSMSPLDPLQHTALELHNQVRAFLNFPKSKYTFFNQECIVLSTHIEAKPTSPLDLQCKDHQYLIIDTLQPAGKRPMTAAAFLNGYSKKAS